MLKYFVKYVEKTSNKNCVHTSYTFTVSHGNIKFIFGSNGYLNSWRYGGFTELAITLLTGDCCEIV